MIRSIDVPKDVIELVAARAAELVIASREPEDQWLNVRAAAEYLSCSAERLYKATDLPRYEWRGRVFFRTSELDRFLEVRRQPPLRPR